MIQVSEGEGGMTVNRLAELMGVSPRECAEFCEGVKSQMARGLDMEAAIRAHVAVFQTMLDHVCKRQHDPAYADRMKAFVVDAFFPARV